MMSADAPFHFITAMKIDYKCAKCGGYILVDAWLVWNVETQDYEIQNIFDDTYCPECEETNPQVEEVTLED
jgi:Zn finger protein HypA/HybF involved in hydrogenase expression